MHGRPLTFADFTAAARPARTPAADASLTAADGLPALVVAERAGTGLAAWLGPHLAGVLDLVHRHGAVLLRGFDVGDAPGMAACVEACSGALMDHRGDTSPRSRVHGRVRTSTDHPADQRIVLHNEYSYSAVFPLRLFFHCVSPAAKGGQTPLADCRRIYQRIDPEIRERFRRRGWLYARHFVEGFGQSWQVVYHVETRDELEAHLRSADIDWEWTPAGTLKTRMRRASAAHHPTTGELVWFNHIVFWHHSSLEPGLRALLLREYGEEGLPHDSRYGDGTPIEPEVLDTLRAAYDAETRAVDWTTGDFAILDNMLVAHGRAPFEGDRRVLFAMAEPIERARIRDAGGAP